MRLNLETREAYGGYVQAKGVHKSKREDTNPRGWTQIQGGGQSGKLGRWYELSIVVFHLVYSLHIADSFLFNICVEICVCEIA